MLKQRLITALLLIPLIVTLILMTSTYVLAWVLAAFVLLAAWEWSRLMGLTSIGQRCSYVTLIAIFLFSLYGLQHQYLYSMLAVVMLLWCAAIAWMFYLNRSGRVTDQKLSRPLSAMMGVWLLVPTWLSLLHLHNSGEAGPVWVLLLMLLIWGADSGAYFAGRRWGKRKLAVNISPGKTWEGVSGGVLSALFLVLPLTAWLISLHSPGRIIEQGDNILSWGFNAEALLWFAYAALCLLTIAFSVCGDLFESVAKRKSGFKDSGQILPGHGGVLDRIDSLTAAAPCFTFGLLLLNVIPADMT